MKHAIPKPSYEKNKFEGKVVIITGSSSGIGQAAALLFALEGASVTIHGQNVNRLKACAEKIMSEGVPSSRILSVIGSVDDDKVLEKIINDTIQKFGRLDVLINNAGIGNKPGVSVTDNLTMENYEYVMDVNLRAPIKLIQLAVPHLAKTRGNIINISSDSGLRPLPTMMYYSISKACLDHYTRNAAIIYANQGIRVNAINPGAIETSFVARTGVPQFIVNRLFNNYTTKYTPAKRTGIPYEMATVMKFLASDDASYVTGANIVADGGTHVYVPGSEQIDSVWGFLKKLIFGL